MAYQDKKYEPGIDDDQAQKDRARWQTTVAMVSGDTPAESWEMGGGTIVGNPYDTTGMGEDYNGVTYEAERKPPDIKGGGMSPNASQPVRQSGGGMAATAPQTMTKGNGD